MAATRVDADLDKLMESHADSVKGRVRFGGKIIRIVSPDVIKLVDTVDAGGVEADEGSEAALDTERFWSQLLIYVHPGDHAKFQAALRKKGMTADQLSAVIEKFSEIASGDIPTKEAKSS